ncbi:MAG: DUF308 domain-containing protein, partial [Firmicutes bacterium]|nr:DUF308 domain-containing protein [Bacillota bacterium]
MFKVYNFKSSFSHLSIVYILLGLFLLIFPTASARIICSVLGLVALVIGAFRLINYFRLHSNGQFLRTGFISGFIFCALGLFFILKPTVVMSILPFIIGLAICFNGIVKMQSAIELRRANYDKWIVSLVIAAITLLLGILLIINPFSGAKLAIMFVGAALVIDGITNIITMRTVKKKVSDAFDY